MKKLNLVIIEDEEILRETLYDDLVDVGYSVKSFDEPISVLEYLKKENCDVIISDIRMPEMSGLEFLSKIKALKPEIYVIMMTAFGSVESAVEAMKLGAYDYLTKPFDKEELLLTLKKISELISLKKKNQDYQYQFSSEYSLDNFVGESSFVNELRETILTIANSNSTILITGETGTGKELIANLIHYNSSRRNEPLIKISCAVLSKEVIESELFGHEKGAYTGAEKQRIGRFEAADGGTIYLDDIDDVPLEVQVKLLRVLQEQEIERVGSNEPVKINVRIIVSTKKNLLELIKQGKFRKDLYYRLNIIPIHIKPLRERREDILPLLNHFITNFSEGNNINIGQSIQEILRQYSWPGNVRELKNLTERLVILSGGSPITISHLPNELFDQRDIIEGDLDVNKKSLNEILEEIEIKIIKTALMKTAYNKSKAADLLSLPVSTLKSKIEKYSLG